MAVVKPLYLGKTMEDLNRLSNADTKKTTNPRILASSAVKLYEGAARNVASGDEEKGYILYMRCMSLFQTIRKSALYAKEKKSIEVVLEKVNVMIALGEAERLSKSLAKRYQALRTDRSDGDGARDDKDEPRARPDGSASVATSSSEVYQKLKIGRDTLIQPKIATEDISNGHLVTRKEAPIIVSCEELYHLMKCNAKLLIFDTRSEEEFAGSRIRFDSIVHVPEHLLVSGISAGVILKNIKKEYCELWYSRRDFDHVILMDRNTTAKLFDANPSLPVTNLKNAIYKFDSRAELQLEPKLLDGGFKSWLFHYPTYCTNPNPPKIKNKPKSSSSKIDLFDYPSLPGDEKEPPKPKPPIEPKKEPSPPPPPPTPTPPEPKPTPQIPSRLSKPAQLSQASRIPQGNVPASNGLPDNASLPQPTIRAQTPTIPPAPPAPATVPAPAPATVPAPAPATVPAPAPATVPAPAPASAPAPSNPIVPPQRPPPQPTIQPPAPTLPTPPRAPVVSAPNGPNVNGGSSFVVAAAAAKTFPAPNNGTPLRPTVPPPDAKSKPSQTFPAASSNRTPTQSTVPSPGVNLIPSQAIKTSTMPSVSKGTPPAPVHSTPPAPAPSTPQNPPAPAHSTPQNPQERAVATNFSVAARSAKTVLPQNLMPASKPSSASGAEPSSASNVSRSIPQAPKPPALPNSTPATAPAPKPASQKPSQTKKETPDAKPAPQTSPKSPVTPPSIKSDPETPAETETPPVTASSSIRPSQNPQQTSTSSSPTSGAPSAAPARPSQPKPIAPKSESSDSRASTFVSSRPPVFSNPESAHFRAAPTSPPPSYLPRGWEKCHDSLTNRFYYKDHNTMTTYWTLPKSVVEAMMTKPRPSVDRSDKPRQAIPTVNRENKPIAIAKPSRNLAPVYGNVGYCLTGLKNMGNTCFMSSILQCLNNTTPLARRFLGGEYRRFINKTNPLGSGGCIAEEFAEVCKALWSGQFKSITPRDFKLAMSRFAPQFSGYDQQDSQELLAFLLDGLHEDLNAVRDKPYIEEEDNSDMTDEQAARISWENHLRRNQSIIVDLFQGQFKSTVACSYCGKKSVTFEAFMYLSLPLKASRKNCSLAECLELFTAAEEVSGEDKWLCSNCKKYRKARKKLDIWKLPPILLIHLKRFSYKGLWRQKLETMVDFPVSGLDMRNYIEGPETQSPYNLYGVSNHYGTMTGGHYTAFCKNSYSTKWHSFDDHIVKEASVGSVKSRAAYILFYTSCNFQPPRLTRTA
ncbi:ubiquitin carboxyl-terminal hydrolase 8-like [Oscarella lobularis]|uniref:ubiquitin carboxyl-terminal hydrolase 8-like n=1 Tax=Oscarella lobularis TaxID=121494 RepID=UPI003313E9D6